MTTPLSQPGDREALADLIEENETTDEPESPRVYAERLADEILARWRLVPVEQESPGSADVSYPFGDKNKPRA